MKESVLIAFISFLGTLIGTLGGIVATGKLTVYRIEQLEKKVEVHNGIAGKIPVLQEQIKVINHRLSDLEKAEAE